MPVLTIKTNVEIPSSSFLSSISEELATALSKPVDYCLIEFIFNQFMMIGATPGPVAMIELKSIGLDEAQAKVLAAKIPELLHELNINKNRMYIEFTSPERKMFGFKGSTL